jgi:hypothetical protein
MTDDPNGERRRKYFAEYADRVGRHQARMSEYDRNAIDFASSAMRALSYLNGGALVAIPTGAALFKADPIQAKTSLIAAGLCFVAGLISIVMAQAFAFFTQARRAESESLFADQQIALLATVHYPDPNLHSPRASEAATCEQQANAKIARSHQWRRAALAAFWLALLCFIAGCYFGARAILPG